MKAKMKKILVFLQDTERILLDCGIMVYMGLLIVVLPLYFEQGYGYIATDKASFFGTISVNMGKVLFPLLIVYAITSIAVNHAKIGGFFRGIFTRAGIKKLICRISAVDFFVGMYGVSVVLSYLCSDYQEAALWGTAGWYMGLIPQLILVCGYFVIAKCWTPRKWFYCLFFPVAAVVFALGYMNCFGYYPIEMEYAGSGFISTIGNINWYCGYVVPVLFVGIGLFWWPVTAENNKSRGRKALQLLGKIALGGYIFLGFATLVIQGSASGLFALGVMMGVLLCLSSASIDHLRKFWIVTFLLSMSCIMTMIVRNRYPEAMLHHDEIMDMLTQGWIPIAMTLVSCVGFLWTLWYGKSVLGNEELLRKVIILCMTLVSSMVIVYIILLTINTIYPGAIGALAEYNLFTFADEWGSMRGATWKIGAKCFQEQNFLHKLVGVGPDAMWQYIETGCSETLTQLMQKNFGTNRILTNAHNEWLTILVNYGILGLVSFAGMIVSAVWTFLRNGFGNRQNGECEAGGEIKCQREVRIPVACALGILAYSMNNIFSFQQVVNVTMLFLLLGMGRAFTTRSCEAKEN